MFSPEIVHAQVGSTAANTAVQSLMDKIIAAVVIPAIELLFALAILLFIWGVAGMIIHRDSLEDRAQYQNHILWGVIGMFIMISSYGIIRVIANTIGVQAPF